MFLVAIKPHHKGTFMRERKPTLKIHCLLAVALTLLSASPVAAEARVTVSGRVCDSLLESEFAPPATAPAGRYRCREDDVLKPGVLVTARSTKSKKTVSTAKTRADGDYRLRLKPGRYLISAQGCSYQITLRAKKSAIKEADFVRNMPYIPF